LSTAAWRARRFFHCAGVLRTGQSAAASVPFALRISQHSGGQGIMLVWGSKGVVADLGAQSTQACPTCERERPFKLALQYKLHHVWYLFKWVSNKQYMLLCDVCQRGAKLDAKQVEAKLQKNPIPFGSRFGWAFLVALIGIAIAFGAVEGEQRGARTAQYVDAPRAGDLYVVNVAKLLKSPETSVMYGVMRVKTARDGQIEFDMPATAYNKVTAATKDVQNGKMSAAGYFVAQTLTISSADLQSLKKDGSIHSIERR
jgi:hypothetical protein